MPSGIHQLLSYSAGMLICLQILRTLKVMRQILLSEERDDLG